MAERLRIAQIAPIAGPVTPESGGSIEQLVRLLTDELVRRGHDVTLFATGDSRTTARLHAEYPCGYEHDGGLWHNWRFHETMHVAAAFERAAEFDVIHSHVYHHALPFTRLVATPIVHSYHILPGDDIARAFARYPDAHVVALSDCQRRAFAGHDGVPVVRHGIDTDAFADSASPGDYLFFLGEIKPSKGPLEAIGLAARAEMPLVLAGPARERYYRETIAPLVDGRRVRYAGVVDRAERNRLLMGAAALLYPIHDPEPFGLVMIEAMACGTPVVAHGIGAAPEIVEDGLTGYTAGDPDGMIDALRRALVLNREAIRRRAVERWDYRRMVDGYEAIYRRLAAAQQGRTA